MLFRSGTEVQGGCTERAAREARDKVGEAQELSGKVKAEYNNIKSKVQEYTGVVLIYW